MEKLKQNGKSTLVMSKVQSQLNLEGTIKADSYSNEDALKYIWASASKFVAKNELEIIQMPTNIGGVISILFHSIGANLSSICYIPAKESADNVTEVITSARIFSIASFLGVVINPNLLIKNTI